MYLTNVKRDDGDMNLEIKLRYDMLLLPITLLVKQLVKKVETSNLKTNWRFIFWNYQRKK